MLFSQSYSYKIVMIASYFWDALPKTIYLDCYIIHTMGYFERSLRQDEPFKKDLF